MKSAAEPSPVGAPCQNRGSRNARLAQVGGDFADDYMTLSMLSAGLARIRFERQRAEEKEPGLQTSTAPKLLPTAWRAATTRLWWRALEQGVDWPRSDLDVFAMCRRPLGQWPLQLNVSSSDRNAILLDGDALSEFADVAVKLAASEDVEAELLQNKTFANLLTVAQMNGATEEQIQRNYVYLRRYLVDNPYVSDKGFRALARKFPKVAPHGEPYLTAFFLGAYHDRDGAGPVSLMVCDGCGNQAEPGLGPCPTPGCSGKNVRRTLDALGVYYVQNRATRQYFHDPGLVEVRVMKELEEELTPQEAVVHPYPHLDAWDVAIEFKTGSGRSEWWAGDAKDCVSPSLLGRGFKCDPRVPASQRFLVLPMHRFNVTGYVSDLERELEGRVNGVRVVSERNFIDRVLERTRRGGLQ